MAKIKNKEKDLIAALRRIERQGYVDLIDNIPDGDPNAAVNLRISLMLLEPKGNA